MKLVYCEQHPCSEKEDHAVAQQLQELYEQVLSDLQNGQQELEISAQQVEEWCCECEEAKQLHDMTVAEMAELEEENQRVAKQ